MPVATRRVTKIGADHEPLSEDEKFDARTGQPIRRWRPQPPHPERGAPHFVMGNGDVGTYIRPGALEGRSW